MTRASQLRDARDIGRKALAEAEAAECKTVIDYAFQLGSVSQALRILLDALNACGGEPR